MHAQESLQKLETLEEIREILSTASFPCTKYDILKCAQDARAPRRIIHILKERVGSSKKFKDIDEIISQLADSLDTHAYEI